MNLTTFAEEDNISCKVDNRVFDTNDNRVFDAKILKLTIEFLMPMHVDAKSNESQ